MRSTEETPTTVTVTNVDGSTVAVAGEFDLAAVGRFDALVDGELEQHATVRIDLAGVTFADSSALGALVGAYERAMAAGKLVCVSAVSDVVDALFHIAGLNDELRC